MSSLVLPSYPGLKVESDGDRSQSWGVRVFTSESGNEQRTLRQSRPRYRYRLQFMVRSTAAATEFQSLVGFLARHSGPYDSFLLQDPADYTLTAHPFGVGNGTATSFQLQRTLVPSASLPAAASRSYWPTMGDGYEPVEDIAASPTPAIYKNAVLQTVTTHYTIGSGGVVEFVSAPTNGHVLTATLNYYRRVRLAEDNLSTRSIVSGLWSGDLELVSVIGGSGVVAGPDALTYSLPFTLE